MHEDRPGAGGHAEEVLPVRLFVVDDQQMFSEALTLRLSRSPELWVVGHAPADHPGLTDLLNRLRPNVITVDVGQLGVGAVAVLDRLLAACPGAHLVVVTGSEDPTLAVEAARAGVVGWVSKSATPEHLVDVLRAVSQGHAWYPPRQLGVVLRELRADARRDRTGPLDALSARELEVLHGLVDGLRGAEIAAELQVSANTIRTHTNNIFSKLGVHSRLEAVSLARSAGLRPRRNGPAVIPLRSD